MKKTLYALESKCDHVWTTPNPTIAYRVCSKCGAIKKRPYRLKAEHSNTLDPGKKLTVRKKLVKRPKVLRYIDFKGSGLIRVLERTTDHFPEFALYMKMSKALRKSLVDAGFTQEQRNKWVLRTNRFSIFVYT